MHYPLISLDRFVEQGFYRTRIGHLLCYSFFQVTGSLSRRPYILQKGQN